MSSYENLLLISELSTKELFLDGDIGVIDNFYSEFFKIIALKVENHTVMLDSPFIKITDEKKENIANLVTVWKDKDKHVFQLKKFFDEIPNGKYITIIPKHCLIDELYVYLLGALKRLNMGIPMEEVLNSEEDVSLYRNSFSELLSIYSAECNTSYIGIKEKEKRTCRFCGKSMPDVTFKKIAHAIPEGLGNKNIFDNEECDFCNERFGSGLDNELIDYFSFHRGVFGIRGKKGNVKNKFKNGYIVKDENGINIACENIKFDEKGKPQFVEFISEKKLIPQNIYKALARVSLGTIKSFDKDIFSKTLNWINNSNFYFNSLPLIAMNCNPNMYTESPDIFNYIRKEKNELPFFVSELHIKFMVLVYIVPVCEEDFCYSEADKYEIFWKTFKHYAALEGWQFLDFTSNISTPIKYKMKLIESTTYNVPSVYL